MGLAVRIECQTLGGTGFLHIHGWSFSPNGAEIHRRGEITSVGRASRGDDPGTYQRRGTSLSSSPSGLYRAYARIFTGALRYATAPNLEEFPDPN